MITTASTKISSVKLPFSSILRSTKQIAAAIPSSSAVNIASRRWIGMLLHIFSVHCPIRLSRSFIASSPPVTLYDDHCIISLANYLLSFPFLQAISAKLSVFASHFCSIPVRFCRTGEWKSIRGGALRRP